MKGNDMNFDNAIKELREIREADKIAAERKAEQERLRSFECPDCKAILYLESAEDLPIDLKVRFVKHQC